MIKKGLKSIITKYMHSKKPSMWSDFLDDRVRRKKIWSEAHTNTTMVFCGGFKMISSKKIRKRTGFEVLIFYYCNKRRKRNKESTNSSLYMKRMISESRDDSESFFLYDETSSKETITFRCLYCIEIGRIIYLKKQFFVANHFSNL
jgi:hypothetical protein